MVLYNQLYCSSYLLSISLLISKFILFFLTNGFELAPQNKNIDKNRETANIRGRQLNWQSAKFVNLEVVGSNPALVNFISLLNQKLKIHSISPLHLALGQYSKYVRTPEQRQGHHDEGKKNIHKRKINQIGHNRTRQGQQSRDELGGQSNST